MRKILTPSRQEVIVKDGVVLDKSTAASRIAQELLAGECGQFNNDEIYPDRDLAIAKFLAKEMDGELIEEASLPKSNTFHINPFQSEAQRKWMWATDPAMAHRWEKETSKKKRLVKRVRVNQFVEAQFEEASVVLNVVRANGGPGSGNFDHAGRPGERGGSAKEGGDSGFKGSSFKISKTVFNLDEEDLQYVISVVQSKDTIDDVSTQLSWTKYSEPAKSLFRYIKKMGDVNPGDVAFALKHPAFQFLYQNRDRTQSAMSGISESTKRTLRGMGTFLPDVVSTVETLGLSHLNLKDPDFKKILSYFVEQAPNLRFNGSSTSGNFGHAGRPGERGGSASSSLSMSATWSEKDGWMQDGNKPLPDHIAKLSPPPGWKKIWFNPDPSADLLLQGIDSKGRVQSRYSDTHSTRAAAAKFNRVSGVVSRFDSIKSRFKKESSNEAAACAALVAATGMRPGSEKDTGAEIKGYGATTLLASHVKEDADGVFLEFIPGKKHGETITMRVDDKEVGKMLLERKASRKPDEKLFGVSSSALSQYVHDVAGCKTKDLRTAVGTMTAIREIRKIDAPSSFKEYKSKVKAVATAVSEKLGNTPTIALAAYIDPVVFAAWRKPEWSTK